MDKPKENDVVFTRDGVKFIIENGILEQCGGVVLDLFENNDVEREPESHSRELFYLRRRNSPSKGQVTYLKTRCDF